MSTGTGTGTGRRRHWGAGRGVRGAVCGRLRVGPQLTLLARGRALFADGGAGILGAGTVDERRHGRRAPARSTGAGTVDGWRLLRRGVAYSGRRHTLARRRITCDAGLVPIR